MLLLLLLSACAAVPRTDAAIDAIELYAMPVPVDLDGRGKTGWRVRVIFYHLATADTVTMQRGELRLLLLAGDESGASAEPVQIWTFQPADLERRVRQTMIGPTFMLDLPWKQPPRNAVALVAEYHGPAGATCRSAPVAVAGR